MILRRIGPDDVPDVVALLSHHTETSMFPLNNLELYGLDGSAPYAMTGWMTKGGTGVVFLTNSGMVMPQMPQASQTDWDAVMTCLRDRDVTGVSGPADQVRRFLDIAGLAQAPCDLNADEPGLRLRMTDLRMPNANGLHLVPLKDALRDMIVAWRSVGQIESLGAPPEQALVRATREYETWVQNDRFRVLMRDDIPVSMTGFNAVYGDTVQLGGVFTPKNLRNRGYARAAVALHLQEVAQRGITTACLFAANQAAVRAYTALGFEPYGAYGIVLFQSPQQVQI